MRRELVWIKDGRGNRRPVISHFEWNPKTKSEVYIFQTSASDEDIRHFELLDALGMIATQLQKLGENQ